MVMEVYLQESCTSDHLIQFTQTGCVMTSGDVGQSQLRAGSSAYVIAVGQMCPMTSLCWP